MANYKKNLNLLNEHLDTGEKVEVWVDGMYETSILGSDTIRRGVMAATNKRVIFYAKKAFGYDMEVFPYKNISSIEMGKEMLGHRISFFAIGNKVTLKWIQTGDFKGFVQTVQERIGNAG